MNRIKMNPLANATEKKDTLKDEADHKTTPLVYPPFVDEIFEFDKREAAVDNDYTLFFPLHYVKSYEYPLVVWLHDDGDSCQQIQRIMPWISKQNYVGVSPQAPVGDPRLGYFWEQTRDSIHDACESVHRAVHQTTLRANIATDRVYIGGAGAAGTMAFRIAFDRPELFRGVISINGGLPEGQTPFARLGQSRLVEVFWTQCRDSELFQTDDLCKQLRVLHAAGFSTTVRQYPCGDKHIENSDGTFKPLEDLNRWIMSHIKTTVS